MQLVEILSLANRLLTSLKLFVTRINKFPMAKITETAITISLRRPFILETEGPGGTDIGGRSFITAFSGKEMCYSCREQKDIKYLTKKMDRE